ncbi:MAG: hypothetical protein KAS32_17240, partial [Candidatus Peribacteraceae bacterium]|nr:hypothetical protein [Candidatus Peribacteraceae bacterium]
GFLIGFEIPLVLRINKKFSDTLGTNLASIYAADYIGAFVGAMVWTYYLLRKFPLTHISFILAGINFFVACITILYFQYKKMDNMQRNVIPALLMLIVLPLLFIGLGSNQQWSLIIEQKLYDDKIVYNETTKYQHLVMTHNSRVDEYRFFINGNLQWSSSDEAIYHELLVHPVMNMVPDHERVLILGGGDGMALREVQKYPDVKEILLVDLDPEMTKISAKNEIISRLNGGAFDSARVKTLVSGAVTSEGQRPVFVNTGKYDDKNNPIVEIVADIGIINIDADKFVDEVKGKWSVVIIDLPDPNSIELAKMYSKEFFMKLRRVISETGMIVIQSTSPYHAKEAYLCIMRTMQAAGLEVTPYHHNVPSFGDWGWVLAQKPANNIDMNARLKSIGNLNVDTRYITPDVFEQSLIFGKGLLESKRTSVSTLMEPVILELYMHHSWLLE